MPDDDSYPPPSQPPPGPGPRLTPAPSAGQTETWLASRPQISDDRRPARTRSVLPWILAAIIMLTLAILGGYGAAYLVANLQHVPAPAGAVLPTATPSGTPAAGSPPTATATPDGSPAATRPPLVTRPPQTPSGTPRVHVVARGESLSLIAEQYGVDPQAIIDLNEIENPNRIFPGQELLIPSPGS